MPSSRGPIVDKIGMDPAFTKLAVKLKRPDISKITYTNI